ncbi:MAG: HTTM domain-containing protein [Sneathiellales bacterium]|nr:HTTM domain-containing protein [Sneathiellales bacterium]
MSFDDALRLTEILLGLVFLQQCAEHLKGTVSEQVIYIPRALLSGLLVFGFFTSWICLGLWFIALAQLHRFQGPYNGGSDRMSHLVLSILTLTHFLPEQQWKELAFGYLALQLTLSYFISGWVKVVNPEWRAGQALQDVFRYSAYPVSEQVRGWADHPRLLLVMSWSVILFELAFPLSLLSQPTLIVGLVVAATFHFTNACLFGLNRFFWIWLTAYPSILWLQDRIF